MLNTALAVMDSKWCTEISVFWSSWDMYGLAGGLGTIGSSQHETQPDTLRKGVEAHTALLPPSTWPLAGGDMVPQGSQRSKWQCRHLFWGPLPRSDKPSLHVVKMEL